MSLHALLKDKQLDQAVSHGLEQVRANPAHSLHRVTLIELLALAGDYEKADKQLAALEKLDQKSVSWVHLWRQLMRAEQIRLQVMYEGRVPALLHDLSATIEHQLHLLTALREGDDTVIHASLDCLNEAAESFSGQLNGHVFSGLRDLDDRYVGVLEWFSPQGDYAWVDWHQVSKLETVPAERLMDRAFRSAELTLRDGSVHQGYLPLIYPQHEQRADEACRLGCATQWFEHTSGVFLGLGGKMVLAGEMDLPLAEVVCLELEASSL